MPNSWLTAEDLKDPGTITLANGKQVRDSEKLPPQI